MDTFAYVFLAPFIKFLIGAIQIYSWILIARAIMSFFIQDYYSNPIVNFIFRITEPLLSLARRFLPFLRIGMFDFSIIAVFIGLEIIERLLMVILVRISGYSYFFSFLLEFSLLFLNNEHYILLQ